MADRITRVLVPTEKVVEVRNKQKRETEQKFFPGYVLVEMDLTDDTWHLVRSTPKVTGFVGSGAKPVSLPADQVDEILRQMEAGAEKPKPKSVFQKGDKVRVIDGPFVNFQGTVDDINPERGRMRVTVPVFGRPTPVELEYYQVERM
jgi:transcriptional antiterminator NusG